MFMARGGISYDGIYSPFDFVTMKADSGLKAIKTASGAAYVEGKVVTVTANDSVGFGTTGKPIDGIINKYEDDDCVTVQTRGFATVPGVSGSIAAAGTFVTVNGAGAVASATVGRARVVKSDSSANVNTCVILLG